MGKRYLAVVGGSVQRLFGWTIPDSPLSLGTSNEGVAATFDIAQYAYAPEGTTAVWALRNAPAGVTIDAAGTLTKAAGVAQAALLNVEVSLSQATPGYAEVHRVFTMSVNGAPVWVGSPASLSLTAGSTHNFGQYASDPENTTLTYSIQTNPGGYTINSSTGVVTMGSGSGGLVVRATDTSGLFSNAPTCTVTIQSSGAGISTAALLSAGYVVAVAPTFNVDPTGTNDSTAGMQAAFNAGFNQRKPIWIPSGTYRIRDTLRCYEYQLGNGDAQDPKIDTPDSKYYAIYGAKYPNRPVLKLDNNLTPFGSQATPRPMIHFQNYMALNYTVTAQPAYQSSPYSVPAGFEEVSPNNFDNILCHVDFNLGSGNTGADGVSFNSAQRSMFTDCKITATGANRGVQNGPGQGSVTNNIEIIGGRIPYVSTNGQGSCIVGLKITADTNSEICYEQLTQSATTIVGFEFSRPGSGSVYRTGSATSATMVGTLALVDGTISVGGGVALNNTNSANLYVRNVYVSGTDQLAKAGSAATWQPIAGGTKLINEYVCTNPAGVDYAVGASAPAGATALKWSAYINGTKLTILEPVKNAVSAGTAPSDIRTKHIGRYHRIEDGAYVDIRDHGATLANARPGIIAAIAAAKTAGHGRVLIPLGTWNISSTITLDADSHVFGVDGQYSTLHANWVPTTSDVYVIDTPSSLNGTATLSFLKTTVVPRPAPGYIQNHLRWRVGKYSSMFNVIHDHTVNQDTLQNNRKVWVFEGNGGGQHWTCEGNGRGFNGVGSRVLDINNTTQPLSVYGIQAEISKRNAAGSNPTTNVEVTNSENVRLYMTKREGNAGTLIVNGSSQNVAWYGQAAARGESSTHYFLITDTASNVLIAAVGCQTSPDAITIDNSHGMLKESGSVGSVYQPFPNGVSLYKRGTIDDSVMVFT